MRTSAVRIGMHIITDHCMGCLGRTQEWHDPKNNHNYVKAGVGGEICRHTPLIGPEASRPFSLSSHHEVIPPVSRLMMGSTFELSVLTEGASDA